jgi:phenylalanyl-tRNA synthetase beta chain
LLAGDISVDGKNLGVYAQLSPARCRAIDLDAPAFVAEIDLPKLLPLTSKRLPAEPLPQFPGSSRDIAMELPIQVSNAEIGKALNKYREPLLVSASCFDMFQDSTGEKLPADRKSIAWSFSYRAADRTLKSEEIDAAHQQLRAYLEKSLPVTFR